MLAHNLNSYHCPHMLPPTANITSLEHWLLLKDTIFIFQKYMINCFILYNTFYIVNACLCVTITYLHM